MSQHKFATWINEKYQVCGHFHELTCTCREPLQAEVLGDQVILKCKKCQSYWQRPPSSIVKLYETTPDLPAPFKKAQAQGLD